MSSLAEGLLAPEEAFTRKKSRTLPKSNRSFIDITSVVQLMIAS